MSAVHQSVIDKNNNWNPLFLSLYIILQPFQYATAIPTWAAKCMTLIAGSGCQVFQMQRRNSFHALCCLDREQIQLQVPSAAALLLLTFAEQYNHYSLSMLYSQAAKPGQNYSS